ncbi:whey acidic protein-like [Spea bombifrons]|uniref:whey acidic protein-like n=1 Tax=Spea bombifrons TaxID=233779 RepID=UPI00234AE89F|nr:whey acidic protein-like [Spea bombifrons]
MASSPALLALGLVLSCLGTIPAQTVSKLTPSHPEDLIAIKLKPGTCPLNVDYPTCENAMPQKSECETDADCRGKKKCCYSGCRNRCLDPLTAKVDSCPYFNASICMFARPLPNECHSDKQCPGSQRCCCFNCRRQCSPTVKVKPGQCPSISLFPMNLPKRHCQSDSDCQRDLKCCDSCGKKCVKPLKERPGNCPVSLEQISCITTPGKPLCGSDRDCKPGLKCCLSDDRMQCVTPITEKNGFCPIPVTRCAFPPPLPKCKSDHECPGRQKCCTPLCLQECTDPLTEDPVIPAPVEPRNCPVVNTLVACKLPYPKGDCTTDADCPANRKCCDYGCIFKCIEV